MKRLLTTTTAIATLAAGAALAATDIDAVDMDGDGFADVAEVKAAFPEFDVVFFSDIDTNDDNRIGPQEILETEAQDILARYEMVPLEERVYARVDADMNGYMEYDEIKAFFPGLSELDYEEIDNNDDNRVTYDEYYNTEAQDIMARAASDATVMDIAEIDSNGDDFADFNEMVAAYPGLSQLNFEEIDENDDNRISSTELYSTEAQNILARSGS